MKIIIQGVKQTPSWEVLQEAIQEMLKEDGKLIRIRKMEGCNYRGLGKYQLSFRGTDITEIDMEIS